MRSSYIVTGEMASKESHKAKATVETPTHNNKKIRGEYSEFIVIGFTPQPNNIPSTTAHACCSLPELVLALKTLKNTIMESLLTVNELARTDILWMTENMLSLLHEEVAAARVADSEGR